MSGIDLQRSLKAEGQSPGDLFRAIAISLMALMNHNRWPRQQKSSSQERP
jgi:hypothetical protein